METFEEHYTSMMDTIRKRMPDADFALIDKAVDYANKKHAAQKRKDGSPYIIHPLAVAQIVTEMGLDMDAILGALLHDCIEDTDASHEEIEKLFGPTVAELVEGVTKLTRADFSSREQAQMENLRKMFMAMSKDIRVVLIKIADRLHNIRTMQYQSPEKQIAKCQETMDIYAPLAHRLGMQKVKWELEDTSLKYLAPKEYNEITAYLQEHKDQDESFMRTIQEKITQRLTAMGIHNTTYGRIKHVYSIYRKMQAQGKRMDELYDIYAFRVIVDSIPDCYNVLGHIHDLFNLIPGRFKDYISTPKPNMYQSLHTTVIGSQGIPFEVQIRTWEMHHTAEYGIAAHWKYKEGINGKDKLENRLAWIRQIIEAQQETDDVEEIVRTIKNDLSPEDIFAFTPKGDMITLPVGSTIVDFAYAIHTQVGNKMKGAKVDGKLVSLDYQLKTGEIVEIITSNDENHAPNRAWLDICRTNEAKSKIRSWFKKERREENIVQGRNELEKEFKRNFIHLSDEQLPEFLADDMKRHNCSTVDDFYAAIGYGGVILSRIMQRLKDKYLKYYAQPDIAEVKGNSKPSKSSSGVIVEGENNIIVKFAQCCNPLPGDDIVGFITKGHGVSIHKQDCPTYLAAIKDGKEPERWVEAKWASATSNETTYRVILDIVAKENMLIIADITKLMAELHIPLTNISVSMLKNGNSNVLATINAAGVAQLNNIIAKIRKLPDVISVDRTFKN